MTDWLENVWLLLIVLLVGALGYSIYSVVTSEKITLIRNKWACTQSTTSTQIILMPQGNGQIMMLPQSVTECVKYERQP